MPRIPFGSGGEDENKVHNLDDVNDRLYRRDLADRKPRRIDSLHARRFAVSPDWVKETITKENVEKVATHPSIFRKFFYFSLGFAGLAVVFSMFILFTGSNTISNNEIDINVLGNSFVAGGEELPLQVEVVNKNSSALELSDLFIEYDKGGDAKSGSGHVRDVNSLGTIGAGKTATKTFNATLYGTEGSVQDITFTLQYRLSGSNAIFVKTSTFPVTISSAPVALSVDAPQNITPNQELTFTVKTKSNSKNTLSGMLLHIDYPTGFNFTKADPTPDSINNTWNLGDLAPGAERDIKITGTVYGQDGEDRAFHIYTGSASDADKTKIGVTYNSFLDTVSLVKPFIGAQLAINGVVADTVPIKSSGQVNVQVSYVNNLPTIVTNAEVTLQLSGNALDTSSINVPSGFYNSSNHTVVWNSTTEPALGTLQPSDQGQLNLTFSVLPLVSSGTTLASPQVKLSLSMKGKQPDQGGMVSEITNTTTATAVVSSDLGFTMQPSYYSGPFSNTGPIPPKAEQPTTYTITWAVTNSANALSNASAIAQLPTYVDWVGTISPNGEPITYDDTTRTIHWNIGQVPIGTGITASAKTVSFQVRLNPSTSQIGSTPKLVLDATVTAKDSFTGEALSMNRYSISTLLQNDSGFPAGGQIVTK